MATGDRGALGIKNSPEIQHLAFGKPLGHMPTHHFQSGQER